MQSKGLISIGNYSFYQKDILGKGVTGNVYKGLRFKDHHPVVIKAINLKLNQNQITLALLETQIKVLKLLKPHPNLIKTLDIIQDQNFCFIITELYTGGTLKQFLQKSGVLLPQVALKIFHKIVTAYCSISDASILHRDLKPANIMLDQNSLEPVIIDFGFSEIIQTKTIMKAFNVGSPAYMSPEAFTKTLYSEKSDVWALGIILYEMLTGKTLDEGIETKRYFQMLNNDFILSRIVCLEDIFKEILSQVLKMNPMERISIHKIKYILDKHSIMKLNNPMKSLNSSIEFNPSIKSLNAKPFEMSRSNVFEDERNRKNRMTFQSGNFEMRSSINVSMNGSSTLTVFQSNNLKGKLAESRYRLNVLSPMRTSRNLQSSQINRSSVEKNNSTFLRNNLSTANMDLQNISLPNKIQPIQTAVKKQIPREFQFTGNQIIKFSQNQKNQTQYYPLQQKQQNFTILPQKQNFKNPPPLTQSNFHPPIMREIRNQNLYQPLMFKQSNIQQNTLVVKKSPNSKKFSFKKLAQNQNKAFVSNEYFSYQKQQIGKENIQFRGDYKIQGVTQLNFKQNLYSSVHNNSNLTIRNHFIPQHINRNMPVQQSLVRRIL